MSAVDIGMMTVAEFLELRDPVGGQHYELHHGEAVLVPPPMRLHARIQKRLVKLLEPLGGSAYVDKEVAYRPSPEYEVWIADVAVVSLARWEQETEDDYLAGAPDLVIEVLSPSNTMDEMLDKQELCLSSGCRSFWIVDPKRQQVLITGSDRKTSTFTHDMSCPLPEPLEGSLAVRDIYATGMKP